MLAREVMTSPAVTVLESATVKDAIKLLEHHSITAMPVVDRSGHLVGVVSEADVIREMVVPDQRTHEMPVRLTAPPFHARVADVMSTHVLTVTSDTDLAEAAVLMTSTAVKSLPVVDQGRVVGVLSRRDVIHLLARQDSRIEAEVDELFREAGRDWVVEVTDGIVSIDGPVDEGEEQLAQTLACTIPGVIGIHFPSARVV